jgi:hypothetical protein
MFATIRSQLRRWRNQVTLPARARAQARADRAGPPTSDPGLEPAIHAAVHWLKRAQDHSASHDDGVARDFSLINGWSVSYPETTGYIVPTMIDYSRRYDDLDSRKRARRMLDWLVSIQYPDGGFMGGKIDAAIRVPVTFNTGQILLGLAAGVAEFGAVYRDPMRKAADWLRDTLDDDGCWRRYPTPFAEPGLKTYETHVAWGLFEAARLDPSRGYQDAALKQIHWALTQQAPNGWLANCCLSHPETPLTHTLGYALRGFVEAWRYTKDESILAGAIRTANGLLSALRADGWLPGTINRDWTTTANWTCLTGAVQTAHSWLLLSEATGDNRYLDSARLANKLVRRTVSLDGPLDIRGGVKGSFSIDAVYGPYQYLNWAAKFFVDSNLLELDLLSRT